MSNLAIAFNTNGILTAQVILVLREKTDLGVIVFQNAYTANSQHNVTVMDLNPVMHQVEIWDTNDGTTLNALKGQCDMDAGLGSAGSSGFTYIQFVVDSGVVVGSATGICPVDGDTQYVDTSLDGVDYLVSKGGFGILTWGVEIQQIAGGGFEFIDGQVFSSTSEYTVIKPNSITVPPSTNSSSELTDIIIHTADATLTNTDRGKLHIFNFAGLVAVLTMETLVGVPARTIWVFSTHQGSQVNGEIKFQSGQGCWFRGSLRNRIFLGKNETMKIQVKAGVAYCIEYTGCYDRVGERVMSDVLNDTPNTLPMTNSSLYDGTVYKRVYEWLTTVLGSGQKVTQAQYDNILTDNNASIRNNRGKWMVDTVAVTFRTPDMQDNYPKAVASGRQSGSYEGWRLGAHSHPSGTDVLPVPKFQRGDPHSIRYWGVANASLSEPASTDNNNDQDGAPVANGTTNEVKNIGYYPVVII